MKLIKNTGSERVIDALRKALVPDSSLDFASPLFSLFAYAELRKPLSDLTNCNLLLPSPESSDLSLLGSATDRPMRNELQARWLAINQVEPLALGISDWHKVQAPAGESTIVFRDSAFADDVAKTNLTAILQQHGLENVRSL
jgi:hypothetical protein